MKKRLEMCSVCKEETWHMVGRKESHKGKSSSHHITRTTSECTQCGKKEINNRKKGKRIISRKNQSSCINKANLGGKDDN